MEILHRRNTPERKEYREARKEYRKARRRERLEGTLAIAGTEAGLGLGIIGLSGLAETQGRPLGTTIVIAETLVIGALGLKTYFDLGKHLNETREERRSRESEAFNRYSAASKVVGKTV